MPLVPMSIQQQLALRIKTKRKLLRMTQAELAQKVGTSQAAIARIENGLGNPGADLIQRIVDALHFELTLYVRPTPLEDSTPEWFTEAETEA